MSDGEQLLLIVSLIYLSGCLFWVDRRTILLTSWFGKRWKAVTMDYRWGNSSGSVFLLNPFPPLGFSLVSRLLPVSLSPTNIVAYNAQTVGNSGRARQSGKVASIVPETKFSRRGTELFVNGELFSDIGDVKTAHKIVVLLNKIKDIKLDDREGEISSFWKDRLNVLKAKRMIRVALNESRPLRIYCSTVFFLVFAILPLLAIQYNLGFAVLLGIAVLLPSAVIVCLRYLSCHRKNYPICKIGLGGDIAKMAFCPPTALRVSDLIVGKLSAQIDLLPMAFLLLKGDVRDGFLSGYLADLRLADVPDGFSEVVRETCQWQNQTILKIAVDMMPGLKRYMGTWTDKDESQSLNNQEGKEI